MDREFDALRVALEEVERLGASASSGQLLDLGLVRYVDATGERQLEFTPDGSDMLDALRSSSRWAEVERAAARQGIALRLDTAVAAVAASISGGFNA